MYRAFSSAPYNNGDNNQEVYGRVQTCEKDADYLSF